MMNSVKFHSKAFRRGFADGFGAPAKLFSKSIYARTESHHATIDSAWKLVEKALSESLTKEIRRGQTSGETSRRQREAA